MSNLILPAPELAPPAQEWYGEDWVYFYAAMQNRTFFRSRCAGVETDAWGNRQLVFRLGSIRGIMPQSEAGIGGRKFLFLPGSTLYCLVTDIRREKKEVVLSRLQALTVVSSLTWKKIHPGTHLQAGVEAVYPGRGALVDIGGVRALLPVREMAWGWVADPGRVARAGDLLMVKVLTVNKDTGKVLVSLKAMHPDPWLEAADRYREKALYLATVTGSAKNAVFLSFEPGICGISYVGDASRTVGTEVLAQVESLDLKQRRIRARILTAPPVHAGPHA